MRLTEMQEELLLCMRGARFPMARFELHNDAEKELVMTALDNVYMEHPEEEMGLVKKRGEALRGLEERGLISIDFDAPVWVAGDHIVEIQFEKAGVKKTMANYAPLTRID